MSLDNTVNIAREKSHFKVGDLVEYRPPNTLIDVTAHGVGKITEIKDHDEEGVKLPKYTVQDEATKEILLLDVQNVIRNASV